LIFDAVAVDQPGVVGTVCRMEMPESVCQWRDGGSWLPTKAGRVFVRSAPGEGPTLLLLHSYPSSSYDFHGVVPRLEGRPKLLSFLWALDDPVATTNVLEGLRELRPAADIVELPGVGHYPQVEVPEVFTRAAMSLLSTASR
jgi:pimeloyl-ACP methyl ester carboxylesterase